MTGDGKHFDRHLAELGAPLGLIQLARDYPDLPAAWAACERGDWLLWLAARLARSDVERRAVVGAAADCARLALAGLPRADLSFRAAIDAAEAWAVGVQSIEAVQAAAEASARAVTAHIGDGALWAAGSAAWAVAWAAVWLARESEPLAAAAAARHAAEAAAEAAGGEQRQAFLARCAALVRERLAPPVLPNG
jgi:hypothetical protein